MQFDVKFAWLLDSDAMVLSGSMALSLEFSRWSGATHLEETGHWMRVSVGREEERSEHCSCVHSNS